MLERRRGLVRLRVEFMKHHDGILTVVGLVAWSDPDALKAAGLIEAYRGLVGGPDLQGNEARAGSYCVSSHMIEESPT